MRIGLIADIHGNADALRLVLEKLDSANVDRIVCLGDVAVLGPEPAAVIDLLLEAGCDLVRGNTDAWLLDEPSDAIPPSPGPSADLLAWTKHTLSGDAITELGRSAMTLKVGLDDGTTLLCAHGSPLSFEHVIGPGTADAALSEYVAGHEAALIAGGHTHIQMVRPFGRLTFINPGSVGLPGVGPGTPGLPVNRSVRWAEFAVLEVDRDKRRIDLHRVSLDVNQMMQTARRVKMPQTEWWRSRWG